MRTKNYKDLIVWQKSINLAILVFQATKRFPKEELFGIVSQLRRSAYSIPSNIAEGYCRGRRLEYKHFLHIAYGSAAELETQLIISSKINMLSESEFKNLTALLTEILKMLNKMIINLKNAI